MGYEFVENVARADNDAFVQRSAMKNIYQLSAWCDVKDTWEHHFVGVKKDGEMVATAAILFKPLFAGFKLGYITRGPICNYNDKELLKFFFSSLKRFGKKKGAVLIKFDPNIKITKLDLEYKHLVPIVSDDELVESICNCGCRFLGYELDMTKNIQPRIQLNLTINDQFENFLPQKTKKKIDSSLNNGVYIDVADKEKSADFVKVVQYTEQRKNISLRSKEYFDKMLDAYKGHSCLLLAYVDYDKAISYWQNEMRSLAKVLSNTSQTATNKISSLLQREEKIKKEISQLYVDREKEGFCEPIGACLLLEDGKTTELLYSGLNAAYKRYYPAYLLRYHGIKWAKERGCEYFNFGGVQGDLSDGLFEFKSSFGPMIDVYIGEFDLPCSTIMYPIFTKAIPIAKKVLKKIRRKKFSNNSTSSI